MRFNIINPQYCHFEFTYRPGEIFGFNQSDIKNNHIQLVHENLPNPPNFMLSVNNDIITTPPYSPEVVFSAAPTLIIKPLILNQGGTVILTGDILQAVDPNTQAEKLIFTVSDVKQGKFIHVNTTQPITQFNQSQVIDGEIAFKANDTSIAPSFRVSVKSSCSQTSAVLALIEYNRMPVLTNNQLTITGGEPVIFTPNELAATDDSTSLGNLGFIVTSIENGHFEAITLPGTPITAFSQQMVINGVIRFVPHNNGALPSYNISVNDGELSTESQEALVRLETPSSTVINTPVADNTTRNAVIGATISGVIAFAFLAVRLYIEKRMKGGLNNMLINWSSKTEKEDQEWRHNTLEPIVKIFFKKFKTTKFTGYRNEANTKGYIEGIQDILIALGNYRNVDLLKLNSHERLRFTALLMKKIESELCIDNKESACNCGPAFAPLDLKLTAGKIALAVHKALDKNESSDDHRDRKISIFPKGKFLPGNSDKTNLERKEAGLQLVAIGDQKFPSDACDPDDQAAQIRQLRNEFAQYSETFQARLAHCEAFVPSRPTTQGELLPNDSSINSNPLKKISMSQ